MVYKDKSSSIFGLSKSRNILLKNACDENKDFQEKNTVLIIVFKFNMKRIMNEYILMDV